MRPRTGYSRPMAAATLAFALFAPPAVAADTTDISDASRIVAVGGSITEIVYALGEEDRLVARDTTSVYPEAALALPDIGYMRALSPEGVLSVDPDAILIMDGSGPPEAVSVIANADIPVVTVPEEFNREGILAKIWTVGEALGVPDKTDKLEAEVDADLRAAIESAKADDEPARVLFVLSLQGGKVMASGTGTAADGIIAMAGAENVIGTFSGYKQVTDEAVITAAPDVILMMDRTGGDHVTGDKDLFSHPAIAATPAGEKRRVVRMDGAYLLGFGPRTAEAVRDLALRLAKSSAHAENN